MNDDYYINFSDVLKPMQFLRDYLNGIYAIDCINTNPHAYVNLV